MLSAFTLKSKASLVLGFVLHFMLSSTINIQSQEVSLKVQQFLRPPKASLERALPSSQGSEGLCGTSSVTTKPACGSGSTGPCRSQGPGLLRWLLSPSQAQPSREPAQPRGSGSTFLPAWHSPAPRGSAGCLLRRAALLPRHPQSPCEEPALPQTLWMAEMAELSTPSPVLLVN